MFRENFESSLKRDNRNNNFDSFTFNQRKETVKFNPVFLEKVNLILTVSCKMHFNREICSEFDELFIFLKIFRNGQARKNVHLKCLPRSQKMNLNKHRF
jgi:hypothetical protein